MKMQMIFSSLVLAASLSAGWFGDTYQGWITGEALLLRPTLPNNYYTLLGPFIPGGGFDPPGPIGNNITYCPGYKWGYSIEVGVRRCELDLRVDWTSFNTSFQHTTQAGPDQLIWDTQGLSFALLGGRARVVDSHSYSAIDGDAGYRISSQTGCLGSRLFAGVRYARFEVDRNVEYFRNTNALRYFVRKFSDSQGIGPRLGLGVNYQICWGVHFTGQLAWALLMGATKGYYFAEQTQSSTLIEGIRNSSSCVLIPSADLKFGLGWGTSFCCLSLQGEVGYQLDYFSLGVQRMNNYVQGQTGLEIQSKPYSLDGWYFRLGAEF